MPVAMAAAKVVTADHYVLDVLVGAAFGLVGWAVALRLERRRPARDPATRTVSDDSAVRLLPDQRLPEGDASRVPRQASALRREPCGRRTP